MRLWIILLAAAICLADCASQGTIPRDKLSDLAVGRTTSAELAIAWGPPLRESTLPDGRRVLTYRYIENGPTASPTRGFGPISSPTDTVTGQVMLTFDPQGVLLSYDMFGLSG